MVLGLTNDDGMSFLEYLVDGDQGFECLDFVGQDRLPSKKISRRSTVTGGSEVLHFHACPEGIRGLVVPCVDDAASNMFSLGTVSCE
jgi:hypothetical protein